MLMATAQAPARHTHARSAAKPSSPQHAASRQATPTPARINKLTTQATATFGPPRRGAATTAGPSGSVSPSSASPSSALDGAGSRRGPTTSG